MQLNLLLTTLALLPGDGPEWGGFRGNNGVGVAGTELPDELDIEESLLWRTEVPPGYSSPVVSGELLFVTAGEDKILSTIAIDRFTGEERWRREVEFDGKRVGANSHASPSPATDGERVFALFHSAGLYAYDMGGEELWHRPFEPFNIPHGLATSPALHGDTLVLQIDQDAGSYLLALDTESGEERWRVERPGVAHSYATPAIWEPEEGPAQVIVSGSYQIAGYSIADGSKVWWIDGAAWQTKGVPTIVGDRCFVNSYMGSLADFGVPALPPTWEDLLADKDADGNGLISMNEWEHSVMHQVWFIFDLDGDESLGQADFEYLQSTNSANGGLFAIKLGGKGDVTESHVLWRVEDTRSLPDATSPLCHGDVLWTMKNGGVLNGLDMETGEVLERGRVAEPDQYYASPVGFAGKLLTTSLSGQLAMISATKDWEVISVLNLDEETWSTPAFAGDQVFVRTQEAIYCFMDMSEE